MWTLENSALRLRVSRKYRYILYFEYIFDRIFCNIVLCIDTKKGEDVIRVIDEILNDNASQSANNGNMSYFAFAAVVFCVVAFAYMWNNNGSAFKVQ